MNAIRTLLALAAITLGGCDSILGLNDLTPDGAPFGLLLTPVDHGVTQQPLALFNVTVVDVVGQSVRDFHGEIELAIGNNPGGSNLLGLTRVMADAGEASFEIGFDQPGTGYTLVASIDGLAPVTSGPIEIEAPAFRPVPTQIAGGQITSVAASPGANGGASSVFAGAGDTVYRSDDRGASWAPAGFNARGQAHLLAAPGRPGVLYLMTPGDSLEKTVNGGASWFPIGQSLVYSIALGREGSVYIIGGQGIQSSADGGVSWQDRARPPSDCSDLMVEAGASDTLYCTSYQATTAYKSVDDGQQWTSITTPSAGQLLAATPGGLYFVSDDGLVLSRSVDAGVSWTQVKGSGSVLAIAYAPSMPDQVYLARDGIIAVSNDGGATFVIRANVPTLNVTGLSVDPMNPDVVYATVSDGVYVSTDGGATWSFASQGIDTHPITSVIMAPGTSGTVLATFDKHVRRTINGGASWSSVVDGYDTAWLDPNVKTHMHLCGPGYFGTSIDGGASFNAGASDLAVGCGRLVAFGTATFYVPSYAGLARSNNGGASWTTLGIGNHDAVYDAAVSGPTLLAASDTGIYRSTDGGDSFAQIIPTTRDTGYSNRLVTDPQSSDRIVYGSCAGIRISSDGGASFGGVVAGTETFCVRGLWSAGTALYAYGAPPTAGERHLQTSTDGGATWTTLDTSGLPKTAFITSVSTSDDATTVYLGTSVGLYRSTR